MGYASSESTCELLFAHARGGVLHDLPNNLGTFVVRTNGRVGDIGRVAREHTLLESCLLAPLSGSSPLLQRRQSQLSLCYACVVLLGCVEI